MSKNESNKPEEVATIDSVATSTEIDLSLVESKFAITPLAVEDFSLEELLGEVTEESIHSEEDTGIPIGNEIW